MRRLALLGLALLGLVLALPAEAWAGSCTGCGAALAGNWPAWQRHFCPKCQVQQVLQKSNGEPIVINNAAGPDLMPPGYAAPECLTCQPGQPGQPGSATLMRAGRPEAPGYAMLGTSRVLSTEPLPLGTVRTGYQPQMGPGPMGAMPSPTMMSGPKIPDSPTGWVPARTRRPSILAHVFGVDGLSLRHWGEARAEAESRKHAAIPMGNPAPSMNPVREVPASLVYGR